MGQPKRGGAALPHRIPLGQPIRTPSPPPPFPPTRPAPFRCGTPPTSRARCRPTSSCRPSSWPASGASRSTPRWGARRTGGGVQRGGKEGLLLRGAARGRARGARRDLAPAVAGPAASHLSPPPPPTPHPTPRTPPVRPRRLLVVAAQHAAPRPHGQQAQAALRHQRHVPGGRRGGALRACGVGSAAWQVRAVAPAASRLHPPPGGAADRHSDSELHPHPRPAPYPRASWR
jgi:hypothetical protein